jgi:hypothetical protein
MEKEPQSLTRNKILLIAGCSHAAGSEIDGNEDSKFNRQNSFGNQLAHLLKRQAINIAVPGSTNSTIARSVINWVEEFYNLNDDLTVLISWTDSSRVEVPIPWWNGHVPKFHSWFDQTASDFLRINQGSPIHNESEKDIITRWKNFCAENSEWLEIYTLNLILQIQYYLKSKDVNYIMCSSGYLATQTKQNNHYFSLIDKKYFREVENFSESFYEKYRSLGYKNNIAKYWHHSQEPHALYAKELYNFILK